MNGFSVLVVQYGVHGGHPAAGLLHGRYRDPPRVMPYCFGLLRSARHTVLVDTGFADPAHRRRLTQKYGGATWCAPVEALARIGVAADEVDTIVLTHRHFDHAGGLEGFPRARVHIQRREVASLRAALRAPARHAFLRGATDASLEATLAALEADGRLVLDDGEARVVPGVRVRPAFGTHTDGSQYVLVEGGDGGRWVFAGDNVYVRENLTGVGGDGTLVPIGSSTGSQERWLRLADAMLADVGGDPDRVLPFHDEGLWARHPGEVFDDGLHVARVGTAGGTAGGSD